MVEVGDKLKVKVFRFDPTTDQKPYYAEYDVPFTFEKMKIIDVLRYIQEKIDHSLSFTWDCRLWNCGLCGVSVNKRPCLACITDVKEVVANGTLVIEPLPNYPVLKDFVIDRTVELDKLYKLKIKYSRTEPPEKIPEPMDPEQIAIHRDWYLACISCLVCNSACPSYTSNQEEFIGPHLFVKIAKYLSHPRDEGDRAKEATNGGVFSCLGCGRCDVVCPLKLEVSVRTMETLKTAAIEGGYAPPKVRDFLENVYKFGNPFGEPRTKRAEWVKELEVEIYDSNKHEYLLYVGCVASYDSRAQNIAKSVATILSDAKIPFGILGKDENCDGNEVARLGEKGLFELIAQRNIQQLKNLGVEKIITISPHAYNAMKNEYPEFGGDFEVIHYTELLNELIKEGTLNAEKIEAKITYHDPCFLGRRNGIYEPPREILSSISGEEILEMERNRDNSFCCGGGSGNFFTDLVSGDKAPSRLRVREAYNTGAEIIAVSCPICLIMLEDAVKSEGLDKKISVKDISEIVKNALKV